MEKDDKLKALDAALGQIEKQFGKGAVMKLGDPKVQMAGFPKAGSWKYLDRSPAARLR